MTIEATVYKLLSGDKEFNKLLDTIRGGEFGNGYKQGIFTYAIPENPVDIIKPNLAPFVRINPNRFPIKQLPIGADIELAP